MRNIVNIYLILAIILSVVMLIRSICFGFKFCAYILKKYPEKAGIVGIPPEGPFNGFKFFNYIFTKKVNEIDQVANELKYLVSSSITFALVNMILIPVVAVLLMLIIGRGN